MNYFRFFPNRFKFKNVGFTLIELMITLGVISVLSAGTYVGYRIYQTREQTNTAVQSSRTLATTLMQTYGRTGSFANLSTQDIIHGKLFPANLSVSNQTLQSPWGGSVAVAPAVSNEAYALTWGQVPSGICSNMVSQLNRNFAEIQINGQVVENNQSSLKTPLNISSMTQLCRSNHNTVVLTSEPVSAPTTGEKPLPVDHGAVIQPVITPSTKGITSVAMVSPVTNLLPNTQNLPTVLKAPTIGSSVVSAMSVVSQNTTISTLPPVTALPPQTCFPSTVVTPVYTTQYNYQNQACPSGYSGSIRQQQTRIQTVTTTTVTSCSTPWSTPNITNTPVTTYSAWSGWSTISTACVPPSPPPLPIDGKMFAANGVGYYVGGFEHGGGQVNVIFSNGSYQIIAYGNPVTTGIGTPPPPVVTPGNSVGGYLVASGKWLPAGRNASDFNVAIHVVSYNIQNKPYSPAYPSPNAFPPTLLTWTNTQPTSNTAQHWRGVGISDSNVSINGAGNIGVMAGGGELWLYKSGVVRSVYILAKIAVTITDTKYGNTSTTIFTIGGGD